MMLRGVMKPLGQHVATKKVNGNVSEMQGKTATEGKFYIFCIAEGIYARRLAGDGRAKSQKKAKRKEIE